HRVVNGLQPQGNLFDPLDHLLSGDGDLVTLLKVLLQLVVGKMVIIPTERDEHRQPQPQFALWKKPGRQRRYRHAAFSATERIFGPHDPPQNQLGRDKVQFRGYLLADLDQGASMRAERKLR